MKHDCYHSYEYSYRVRYSQEDNVVIGYVDEFPGVTAHGEDPMDALQNILDVVGDIVDMLIITGRRLPIPLSRQKQQARFN